MPERSMPEPAGPEPAGPEPAGPGPAGPEPAGLPSAVREPPYPTELKPYGRALVELARRRDEVLCLSGDLTRQCEVDLFQERLPGRFIHGGMAEANMMSMAGRAGARCGYLPFVHTFGVFATRRPFDQIANAIAYPGLPVRIIGFMPGVSTPGRPQPPGHRRRRAHAGPARHDRGRCRRRGRGPPGRRGRGGRTRARSTSGSSAARSR